MNCGSCGYALGGDETACATPLVCHHYALRQLEGKLPAGAPVIPPMIHATTDRALTEQDYDELRAKLDEIGMKSMEFLVETRGMDAKTAGERITEFNDQVIAAARRRYGVVK